MLRRAVVVGGLALSGLAMGCSWTPPPESIPTFRIDVHASEVTVQGEGANQEAAANVRAQIAGALQEMMSDREDLSPRTPPARFKAEVQYDWSLWPTAACALGVLIMFGCPSAYVTRTVDLTLEVDGQIYEGHGEASGAGSIYYNAAGQSTQSEAVELALKDALQKQGKAIAKRGTR